VTAAVATGPHLFWITSRAAGVTAMVLSSAAVAAGLTMGMRVVRGTRAGDLRVLHEVLSLATIAALAAHALSLLGDTFMHPAPADLLIPFVTPFHRWWSALGITAGWGLTLLGLSYHARGWIGPARWRTAHRFTALAWVMGLGHSLGMGTDAGTTWFLALTAIAVLPPLGLLVLRLAGVRRATAAAANPAEATAVPAAARPGDRVPARLF
jgi:sulfoxide reductase heme-binding subunit YedZ